MTPNESNPVYQLDTFIKQAKARGVAQLVDEGEIHDGSSVTINGRQLKNFGSCGYMSLEFDPRVKNGGIEAIKKYGIEFSTSRVFLSNPLYSKLEDLLEKIFLRPTLMAPTT